MLFRKDATCPELYKFEDEAWTESDREDDKGLGNGISTGVDTGPHREAV